MNLVTHCYKKKFNVGKVFGKLLDLPEEKFLFIFRLQTRPPPPPVFFSILCKFLGELDPLTTDISLNSTGTRRLANTVDRYRTYRYKHNTGRRLTIVVSHLFNNNNQKLVDEPGKTIGKPMFLFTYSTVGPVLKNQCHPSAYSHLSSVYRRSQPSPYEATTISTLQFKPRISGDGWLC